MSSCVNAGRVVLSGVKKEELKMKTGFWVGVFMACTITVTAQVPYSFNYQGVLRGGSGEQLLPPLQRTVDFRLYNSAGSDTPLWGRNYSVLLDTNGLFNVELSDSGAPLSAGKLVTTPLALKIVVANNPTLFLGLTVNGGTEIAPRQQLLSVPFAMMAGDVKSSSGEFTAGGLIKAQQGLSVPSPSVIEGFGTIPIGGIIMWWGSNGTVPNGWVVCNGENGTPNLCDRFVVGVGPNYVANATGGVAKVILTAAQLPNHTHDYKDGYYAESSSASSKATGGDSTDLGYKVTGSGNHDSDNDYIYWRPMSTDTYTGGSSHENLPPYYALQYIMRKQ
jgi:microcystin-dependent protein